MREVKRSARPQRGGEGWPSAPSWKILGIRDIPQTVKTSCLRNVPIKFNRLRPRGPTGRICGQEGRRDTLRSPSPGQACFELYSSPRDNVPRMHLWAMVVVRLVRHETLLRSQAGILPTILAAILLKGKVLKAGPEKFSPREADT